jgi:hypothetical protein
LSEQKQTTMQNVAKGRTIGAFRCLNCYERLVPPADAKTLEWRISWVEPNFPRIRGPVWDVNRRLAEEAVKKSEGGKK